MPESGIDSSSEDSSSEEGSSEDSFREFKLDFDANPYHKVLGLTVLERRPGYGKIVLNKDENTPGGIGGSVHGGVLAAMVDIVMLVALFAEMREGEQPAGTAELSITYLRQTHGEHIYAEANVIKRGRQLSLVEVDITDDDGRLCARGRTLYAFRAG
jgi:1,4-dihydroxy-2-naphthoyl-CoA hydrolase